MVVDAGGRSGVGEIPTRQVHNPPPALEGRPPCPLASYGRAPARRPPPTAPVTAHRRRRRLLVVALVVLVASVLVAPGAHAEPRSHRPPPPGAAGDHLGAPADLAGRRRPRRGRRSAETVISATFRPARAGRPVVLTRWHHRRWQVVERTTLTRTGRVEFSARSRAGGEPVRYRVTALAYQRLTKAQHRPRPLRRVGRPGLRRRVRRAPASTRAGTTGSSSTTPGAAAAAPRARPWPRPSRPARSSSAPWPTPTPPRPATPTTSTAPPSAPTRTATASTGTSPRSTPPTSSTASPRRG